MPVLLGVLLGWALASMGRSEREDGIDRAAWDEGFDDGYSEGYEQGAQDGQEVLSESDGHEEIDLDDEWEVVDETDWGAN